MNPRMLFSSGTRRRWSRVKGREDGCTDAVCLIEIVCLMSVRVECSSKDDFSQFAAAGRRRGFGAFHAVEIAIEDTWVAGVGAKKDQGVAHWDEVRTYICLNDYQGEKSDFRYRVWTE